MQSNAKNFAQEISKLKIEIAVNLFDSTLFIYKISLILFNLNNFSKNRPN